MHPARHRQAAPLKCRLHALRERAREAARQGWTKIITYTHEDEPGTSLRAAGWEQEHKIRGRGWHSRSRARSNTNGWIDKVRWSKRPHPTFARKRPSEETLVTMTLGIPFMKVTTSGRTVF